MAKTISSTLLFLAACLSGLAGPHTASAQASAAGRPTCDTLTKAPLNNADPALARGQFAEAETLFAAMPTSKASLVGQIRAELGQRHVQPALATALQALAAHPGKAMLTDGLAEVRLARGEPVEALANLHKAIVLDPCLARAHYDLSLYLELSGMAASAQRELDTAYRLASMDPIIRRAWRSSQEPPSKPESDIADKYEPAGAGMALDLRSV